MKENELTFKVESIDEGKSLRNYLRHTAALSGRLIKGAAREGKISVNGHVTKLNYVVKLGDEIHFDITKQESQDITPEKIDIQVVYEDTDIIVVNKPPGMVVHPTKSYQSGTLANGLLYYFAQKGEKCIVRLVSRLDMDTSGLILIAKNQFSHMSLARDMQKEEFKKSYLAVIHGNMEDYEGTINLPIFRDEESGIKRIVDSRGQDSITHYKVIETYKNGQLLMMTLETGRTHQIRVHLSYLGHPLFGDSLYGKENDEKYINRQALHAFLLTFPHPKNGKLIELKTDLPADMKQLINKLKCE